MMTNEEDDDLEQHIANGLNGSKRRKYVDDDDDSCELRYGELESHELIPALPPPAKQRTMIHPRPQLIGNNNTATWGRYSYNPLINQPDSLSQIHFTAPGSLLSPRPSHGHAVAPAADSAVAFTSTDDDDATTTAAAAASNAVLLPPSSVPATKKAKKSKGQDKEKRKVHPLPIELQLFNFETVNKDRLIIAEADDPKEEAPIRILKTVITGKGPTEKHWQLEELYLDQLRVFCKSAFGVTNLGSTRKVGCLQALATKIEMGVHYQQTDIRKKKDNFSKGNGKGNCKHGTESGRGQEAKGQFDCNPQAE